MKIFHLRPLLVAISYALAMLAAVIAIYGKELFGAPITGMFIAAGAFFSLFALSVSLHKKAISGLGAGQALIQLTLWLGLLLVILPNALVALTFVIELDSVGLLNKR